MQAAEWNGFSLIAADCNLKSMFTQLAGRERKQEGDRATG